MRKLIKSLSVSAMALAFAATLTIGYGSIAQAAACQWQYKNNGDFTTSKTPVFNSICGVPNGTGDETDFVKVRQDTTGDPTSVSNNSDYTSQLANACADGTKFDVHTYIHNDAMSAYNDNGSGSAVAHDVKLAMTAPLGQTLKSFTFKSTISASNAATVSDTATINCNGEAVKLSLVANSVHIYSQPFGNWKVVGDGAVNGTTKLGTPSMGSGNYWGCWEYRTWVVYEVVVHKVSKPQPKPSTGMCKDIDKNFDKTNNTLSITVHGSVQNATIVGYRIDFGDGTVVDQQSATHQYKQPGKYTVKTYVKVKYANGKTSGWLTSGQCKTCVTVPKVPPHHPPKTPPTPPKPPVTPPTHLVSTGPGSVVALFAGTSGLGAVSHWFYRRRKFSRQ